MDTTSGAMPIEDRLQAIDEKLALLTRELEEQRQARRERKELMDDLGVVGKDVYEAAVVEFERVAPYFDADDAVRLLERLLRNVRSINQMLDRLEAGEEDEHPLNELFRSAHSLKGMSAAMGQMAISERAHELEGLLQPYRDSGKTPDQSVLQQARTLAEELATGVEEVVTSGGKSGEAEAGESETPEAEGPDVAAGAATGEPIEDFEVRWAAWGWRSFHSPDGGFAFADIKRSKVAFEARARGYAAARTVEVDPSSGQVSPCPPRILHSQVYPLHPPTISCKSAGMWSQ